MSIPLNDFDSWPEGILAARIPANNNVRRMEALTNPAISATTAAQPGSPSEMDVYILPASPTGAQWGSFDEGDLVIFYEATWTAYVPYDGLRKFVADEGEDWQFVGDSSGSWGPAAGGGGGTPGGSDTQVQFNDGGSFGGDAGLVYNKTTDTLTVVNLLSTTHTLTGLLLTAASATGGAGVRVPHGAAPTSPVNGDVWTTTSGIYARINGVTVGPLAAAGSGGLTNWTEAVSTTTPNGTVPVVSFTALNAATSVDVAIRAKGTGAFMMQVPDNSGVGGAKRGVGAFDGQSGRISLNQVASGSYSTVFGLACTAAGSNSFAVGQSCSADANGSVALGQYSKTGATTGAYAHASNQFSAPGDTQEAWLHIFRSSTNATPVVLTSTSGAGSASNQVLLQNNSCKKVTIEVSARDSSGNAVSFTGKCLIKRGASAATTAIVGVATMTQDFSDTALTACVVTLTADTTNGCLAVTATGIAATSIRWTAITRSVETVG